jgi:hypothetical protein
LTFLLFHVIINYKVKERKGNIMIVNDKPKTKEVKFCNVPVFMEDGVYYLAIEEISDNSGNCKNAVNLNEGEVTREK